MPRKDVFALLKISEAQLDELLKAAKIPLDLGDYTPHIDRIKAIQAAKGNGSYVDAAAKHLPSSSAIAKKKAQDGLAVQDDDIQSSKWRPSRDAKAIQLAESEKREAAKDIAQAVLGAPFGGINDAVDIADRQIRAIRGEWTDAVFDEVNDVLDSDEMLIFLEKTYAGKRRQLSGN